MAKNKRTKIERQRDRLIVSEMYIKGSTAYDIHKHLNNRDNITYEVSLKTVYDDIRLVLEEWRSRNDEKVDLWVTEELIKIARHEKDLEEAWQKSFDDKVITQTSFSGITPVELDVDSDVKMKGKKNPQAYNSETRITQHGNVSFKTEIRQLIKLRCELLGIMSPVKLDVKVSSEFENMSDEELIRYVETQSKKNNSSPKKE